MWGCVFLQKFSFKPFGGCVYTDLLNSGLTTSQTLNIEVHLSVILILPW